MTIIKEAIASQLKVKGLLIQLLNYVRFVDKKVADTKCEHCDNGFLPYADLLAIVKTNFPNTYKDTVTGWQKKKEQSGSGEQSE